MALEMEISSLFGPAHLKSVDWNNTHHRRSIAASLVKAVYTLERDRQNNRHGHQALAPPWWDFFHFQKTSELIDISDSSIFAAIYKFNHSTHNAPKYVVAFRGTLNSPRDAKLNSHLIFNTLHETSRFQHSMQAIQNLVANVGAANIWLAGHSLGSAMAMLAGKKMAQMNYHIETYLFNPPFLSTAPIGWILDPNLKDLIRVTKSVVKTGLAITVKKNNEDDETFVKLSEWIPYLFVNSDDCICSEYIGYFEHRKKMEKFIGGGRIERIATQNSIRSLVLGAFLGKEYLEVVPLHLLPSACLTVNMSRSMDFIEAHRIHQWWRPDFHGQSRLYRFR